MDLQSLLFRLERYSGLVKLINDTAYAATEEEVFLNHGVFGVTTDVNENFMVEVPWSAWDIWPWPPTKTFFIHHLPSGKWAKFGFSDREAGPRLPWQAK